MSPFFQTEPTPPAACPTAQTTPTLQPTSSLQLTPSLNKLMWLRPGLISAGTTHKPVCSKHCLVAVIGQAVDKRPQWVQQDGRPQKSQPSNGTKMCVQNTEVERLWASDSSGGDAGPAYPQAPTFLSTSLGKRWCSLPFKQSNLILTERFGFAIMYEKALTWRKTTTCTIVAMLKVWFLRPAAAPGEFVRNAFSNHASKLLIF